METAPELILQHKTSWFLFLQHYTTAAEQLERRIASMKMLIKYGKRYFKPDYQSYMVVQFRGGMPAVVECPAT